MASTTTQPLATRVPNHPANQIRQEAQRRGLTVSDVVGEYIQSALGGADDTPTGSTHTPPERLRGKTARAPARPRAQGSSPTTASGWEVA